MPSPSVPDDPKVAEGLTELSVPAATDTPELRIGIGSFLSLTAQIVGLGTSFAVGILVARLFGVQGKGALSLIMQVPGLLILVLDFGIGTSIIYFVSRGVLRPGTATANAIVFSAALGILGAPVIYLLLASPVAVVHDVPTLTVVLAMLILPLGLLAGWMNAVSSGLSNLRLPLWYSITSSTVTVLGLAVLVTLRQGTLVAVVGVSALGTAVGLAVFFVGLRTKLKPMSPDIAAARSTAGFSVKAYLTNLSGLLHERQDILLLGWISGTAAVGLYSVGVSFAQLAWYVPSALSAAILAKGSRRDESSAREYTARTARVAIVFMVLVIAACLIVVPPAIPLLYGSAFAPAAFAFIALLPGVLADGVSRILWSYQTTRGRLYWRMSLGTTVLNLVAIAVLVPPFGAVGAGLASTVSYSVLAVLTVRRFCFDTGVRVSEVLVPGRADLEVIVRTTRQLVFRTRS